MLAPSRIFHLSKRPSPVSVDGVVSTKKRAPPMTVDDAMREGTYLAVLSVLRNTSVHKASQLTNVPESAIRDAIKRFDMTGSVAPNKGGRKEVDGCPQTNLWKVSKTSLMNVQNPLVKM